MKQIEHIIEIYRLQIEASVSSYVGKSWKLRQIADRSHLASHPSAILSDGTFDVFVKMYDGPFAVDQLKTEKKSLKTLRQLAKVRTPNVIDIIDPSAGDQCAILLLEAFRQHKKTDAFWFQAGKALASIHQVHADQYGFGTHNYFGPLYQDNRWTTLLAQFFVEQRIVTWLQIAKNRGHITAELEEKLEQAIIKIPALLGPILHAAPALLHGDAQQNNIITDGQKPVFIDPAIYYGHPEMDLAHVDFFEPVPIIFYQGYESISPIDQAFWDYRKDVWRMGAWAGMLAVDPNARSFANPANSLEKVIETILLH